MSTRKKAMWLIGLLAVVCMAQDRVKDTTPQRIILNLTTEPATSMAVTWRTNSAAQAAKVEVAEATSGVTFANSVITVPANMEKTVLDDSATVFYYSAVMKNLQANTLYAYRVGAGKEWSEWNQFRTAADAQTPIQFVFFGDPQDDIKEYVSRIFRQALLTAPTANFWLFSGDLTSEASDRLTEELFYAGGFVLRMIPSIMVPGNHDNMYTMENGKVLLDKKGKKQRSKILPPQWRAQFTLPENGIPGMKESSYWIDYQNLRLVMINSNDRLQQQAVWMDSVLSHNPNKWTIVSFHHPLYSAGRERDDRDTRDAFLPIFDKHHVDLVLTGHDHAYARSHPLKNGARTLGAEKGTVYVVSVSGAKFYTVNSGYADLMAKTGGYVQLFQVVSIDGAKLQFQAITATGAVYDSFVIEK